MRLVGMSFVCMLTVRTNFENLERILRDGRGKREPRGEPLRDYENRREYAETGFLPTSFLRKRYEVKGCVGKAQRHPLLQRKRYGGIRALKRDGDKKA